MSENMKAGGVQGTIREIRKIPLAEDLILEAAGSHPGAVLPGRNAAMVFGLTRLGVITKKRHLTRLGANVRAVLLAEALDRDFPL